MQRHHAREEPPALAAVKTYRYLRLALVGLVVMLFASLALEWGSAGCVQPTISAYWHTPVRGVLVGVLVTMGICLIALKGNTESEDVLLNLAGILAPGVAFIPTPAFTGCGASTAVGQDFSRAVANNMQSLFALGLVAVTVALVIAVRERGGIAGLGRWDRIGLALGFGATVGGAVWFYASRSTFLEHAHNAAAVPMFLAIVAVVWVNSRDVHGVVGDDPAPDGTRRRYVTIYRVTSVGMLATLALAVVGHLAGWSNALLVVESLLITLFGAFWVVQTRELWDQGLREPDPAEQSPPRSDSTGRSQPSGPGRRT